MTDVHTAQNRHVARETPQTAEPCDDSDPRNRECCQASQKMFLKKLQKPITVKTTEKRMKATPRTILLLALLFCCTTLSAVEVRYAFRKGYTYSYQYTQQSTGKIQTFTSSPSASQPPRRPNSRQGHRLSGWGFHRRYWRQSSTYRRYLKENGVIKGAPAESGRRFFLYAAASRRLEGVRKRQIKKTSRSATKRCLRPGTCFKVCRQRKGLAEILLPPP